MLIAILLLAAGFAAGWAACQARIDRAWQDEARATQQGLKDLGI
ncbi:MAG: hypothetical protein V4675_09965 [Verrucomicrobiota bacterium]